MGPLPMYTFCRVKCTYKNVEGAVEYFRRNFSASSIVKVVQNDEYNDRFVIKN